MYAEDAYAHAEKRVQSFHKRNAVADTYNTACAELPASWDPRPQYEEGIAELKQRLAVLDRFGPDDFEEGTTISWSRTFDRTFTYVALKAGGKWWITGRRADGLIYAVLVESHLSHADEGSINIVTKWAVFE
jgi:hypothetical protein